ncbi:inorganic phosphate transporter [Thermodesulforhabdus norvegica]|uniref:Inorganic phosphate transporter, PiT family n=1 Tax=Thermodesulforhabdus norvegica TaxID=39841 RepID=A0A1I4QW68_9BACT|nr:inorganic phosphate transporter [Thermodesulforhabdus norvegica]SFM44332.1 inorganic phosphate transporter, PiT family [Thermodesulforhabdus norvegica]
MLEYLYLSGGLLMGWSLGANDSANIFGTGVASGLIKYRTAIVITAFFVLLGALIEGGKCLETLSGLSTLSPVQSFFCILAAALTMTLLTLYAIPASSSQAIVGAIMGFALYRGESDFSALLKIIICWVATPFGACFFSVILHALLRRALVEKMRSVPALNALYFWGVMLTGCYGAYALGANNVANVTGPYVIAHLLSPVQATVVGGVSIALGVLTFSKRTMMTVGKGIIPLDPFAALISVLSEALTLHIFTQIGVPVSSSQAIVGAVIGIGIVRDHRTLNVRILRKIGYGWISTPVVSGFLAWLFALGLGVAWYEVIGNVLELLLDVLENMADLVEGIPMLW